MDLIIQATDYLEKIILITLFGLSVWSIAIVFDRRKYFKINFNINDLKQIENFKTMEFKTMEELKKISSDSFYYRAMTVLLSNRNGNNKAVVLDRSLSSFVKKEKVDFEKGLSVLATLGSNAPFVGLFGTVLGIIRSFAYLGSQSGTGSVMSGVSQALFATAIGLFVAIPAVVAYNYFLNQIKQALLTVDSIKDHFIAEDLK